MHMHQMDRPYMNKRCYFSCTQPYVRVKQASQLQRHPLQRHGSLC